MAASYNVGPSRIYNKRDLTYFRRKKCDLHEKIPELNCCRGMATNKTNQELSTSTLNSTEVAIVKALAYEPYTVAEVAELLESTEGEAKKALGKLRDAGWLRKGSRKGSFAIASKAVDIVEGLFSGGQCGAPIELGYEDLTERERKVVDALRADSGRPVKSINELIDACNWASLSSKSATLTGRALGNSRVRNQLRRLVRSSWVENAEGRGKGKYRLTQAAVKRLKRVAKASTPTEGPHKRTKKAVKKEAPKVTEEHASEAF